MIPDFISALDKIPNQMLSYKKKIAKKKDWGKNNLNAFEKIGRRQYLENLRFTENYRMLNGEFLWFHYFDNEGNKDMLSLLTQEFEIPSTLRHYDIISKVINEMVEKLVEFPDIFRVEEKWEEDVTNEYIRTKTEKLTQTVKAMINMEIQQKLLAQGIDVNKQNFKSEDEAMQFQQEVQQMVQAMTPPQIEDYMNTTWQSQGEIWGQNQLILNKERYKVAELEREEFRDMLVTDRCFRHYLLTADGYTQETWNPVNTFFHRSPEIKWVQEGDYAGRIFYLTKSDVINRFGWKFDADDIKAFEDFEKDFGQNTDFNGFPYKVYAPFEDFKSYEIIKGAGYDPFTRLPSNDSNFDYALNGLSPLDKVNGLYRVTEVYWKSLRKLGMIVYIDPDTMLLTKDWVDENFVVPDWFEEEYGSGFNNNQPNTIYWTWIPQVWSGTKICFSLNEEDAIYLDLEPLPFQFKGDSNPYGCVLPVCGCSGFNNRNAQSLSAVDVMKPHQIGHNMVMNQLYQILEKEQGKFMIWDANFFNTMKDWGGENGYEKVAMLAREFGHVFGDTSPVNMKNANPGGQLPKDVDMTLTAMIMSRAKIADYFEQKCLGTLGKTPQTPIDLMTEDIGTGIEVGTIQNPLVVQKFYTDFFQYKRRCLEMDLDVSQYVQSQRKDQSIMYTKSDASRVFIQQLGMNMLLKDLHIYVVNSQELLKQLQAIKTIFTSKNNTSGATTLDLVEIITSSTPSAIKEYLKKVQDKTDKIQQNEQEMAQQELKMKNDQFEEKENRTDGRDNANNQTKKEVAYIQTFNRQTDNLEDTNNDQTPDVLEYTKLNQQASAQSNQSAISAQSNALAQTKETNHTQLKNRELDIKEKALKVKQKSDRDTLRVAKVNKNRFSK